jgi:hypothetical protein
LLAGQFVAHRVDAGMTVSAALDEAQALARSLLAHPAGE